jgi:hypothetical protein
VSPRPPSVVSKTVPLSSYSRRCSISWDKGDKQSPIFSVQASMKDVACAGAMKSREHQKYLSNTTSHQTSHQTAHRTSHRTSHQTSHQTHLPLTTSAAAAHCRSPVVHCLQSPAIATAVVASTVERPGEKEMEMVEGGAVEGEDICRSGDGLVASLPASQDKKSTGKINCFYRYIIFY